MCGRINVHDHGAVQALLNRLGVQIDSNRFVPRYNVAPGARLVVAHGVAPQREVAVVEWGFVPSWARPGQFTRPLINARAETIRTKPSFRRLIKSHRVVIPVNGFYEWRRVSGTKTPFFIRPAAAGASPRRSQDAARSRLSLIPRAATARYPGAEDLQAPRQPSRERWA